MPVMYGENLEAIQKVEFSHDILENMEKLPLYWLAGNIVMYQISL